MVCDFEWCPGMLVALIHLLKEPRQGAEQESCLPQPPKWTVGEKTAAVGRVRVYLN